MTIELDGRLMTNRETAHDYLKSQLALPEYYGRNLDALYDVLTECGEEMQIVVCFTDEMQAHLGGYAVALLETLYQAAEANPKLKVIAE